jgi:hypothetical protein
MQQQFSGSEFGVNACNRIQSSVAQNMPYIEDVKLFDELLLS